MGTYVCHGNIASAMSPLRLRRSITIRSGGTGVFCVRMGTYTYSKSRKSHSYIIQVNPEEIKEILPGFIRKVVQADHATTLICSVIICSITLGMDLVKSAAPACPGETRRAPGMGEQVTAWKFMAATSTQDTAHNCSIPGQS